MGESRVSSVMFDIRKHHHESDLSGCIASEKVIPSILTMRGPLLQPTHPNKKEVACKGAINVTTFKNSSGSD